MNSVRHRSNCTRFRTPRAARSSRWGTHASSVPPPSRSASRRSARAAAAAGSPPSTQTRSERDGRKGRVDGRVQEIQRLIGRSLRAAVDFEALGERSILIDCDVIVADGGTRTASITGGYVALALAVARLREAHVVRSHPLPRPVAPL